MYIIVASFKIVIRLKNDNIVLKVLFALLDRSLFVIFIFQA